MKKFKLFMFALAVIFGIQLAALPTNASASTSTTTTPKALRGTWFEYRGQGKLNIIKITKHSFTTNGKTYSPSRKGDRKLQVSKWGSWYLFNKSKSAKKDLGQYKTTKKLIHGSYKKVLVKYHGIGSYHVFPSHKYQHKYSYKVLN
ncbi:hypothetical protein [Lentilactobacillus kefiri]|uniref:hypothetical protein n=1 Tax=Lentilactobacillus kefiri TaxID=33962 RepID=UPI00207364A8|nr:hypothetical protein [Lentilactobacillus kefiri]